MSRIRVFFLAVMTFLTLPALAQAPGSEKGEVQLPLEVYNSLVDKARTPPKIPRAAPASYALGKASADISVEAGSVTARVVLNLSLEVFDDDWVLLPVLPMGTAVKEATVSGSPIRLVPSPGGLAYGTKEKGAREMRLVYEVDARRSENGYVLPLPLPAAALISLNGRLPGKSLDVAIIPAAGVRFGSSGDSTTFTASIPTTTGVQISWRVPADTGHTISRAKYSGTLSGEAIRWESELEVDLFSDDSLTLKLLPSQVTLGGVEVDGEDAPILVRDGQFATILKKQGLHKVSLTFESPVIRDGGPPRVQLNIPSVPVSSFEVTLPGKKDLAVSPATNVARSERGKDTVSSFFLPMTGSVQLSWNEAIPEEVRTEIQAIASLFHAAHAREGVLYVNAELVYEVTRGETNTIVLQVPPNVQFNRIYAESGGVADWRVSSTAKDKPGLVTIFLDRKLKGEMLVKLEYERLLGAGDTAAQQVEIPLLRATEVHRQHGMVALLAGKELTLKPVEDERVTPVGENELPAFFRDSIDKTVAHTYKYFDESPLVVVQITTPERKVGTFDAQVDTLVSLGEATLKGNATIDINVKSGSIMSLNLDLPKDVNILNVTAPSRRSSNSAMGEDKQTIDLQFTQEMDGQFRIDVAYERRLTDGLSELDVPTVAVEGALGEQGRIAVEALSAVEVQPGTVQQLSTLDVNELPKQLLLKTTNPILLAYKFVHVDPPYKLSLKVTRHKEIQVQEAIIDQASYWTLFTRDGLAVTTARFNVLNSRKQFLRIQLPRGSEVWSAYVNGRAEKPAMAGEGDSDASNVLIKIINSTQGFPVEVIFSTPVDRIGSLGTVAGSLPRPDMLATHSRWDVYLPEGLSYQEPSTNMSPIELGRHLSKAEMSSEVEKMATASGKEQVVEPLRVMVPTAGIRFSFEKLYANQSEEEAYFSIHYASAEGKTLATLLSVLGILAIWLVIGIRWLKPQGIPPWFSGNVNLVVGAAGLLLTAVSILTFDVSSGPALTISGVAIVVLGILFGRSRLMGWVGSSPDADAHGMGSADPSGSAEPSSGKHTSKPVDRAEPAAGKHRPDHSGPVEQLRPDHSGPVELLRPDHSEQHRPDHSGPVEPAPRTQSPNPSPPMETDPKKNVSARSLETSAPPPDEGAGVEETDSSSSEDDK